ncbi:unnamed protein product [Sphenostylis stenocarpa]|uniref:Uncharacterized protein n=1 Tax=Sphenostylis stenocarpa TaxID=92480 RepID=A0AA86V1H3_9FABA|nr:unnamed protein product [Sphenostylis stenocarpa]
MATSSSDRPERGYDDDEVETWKLLEENEGGFGFYTDDLFIGKLPAIARGVKRSESGQLPVIALCVAMRSQIRTIYWLVRNRFRKRENTVDGSDFRYEGYGAIEAAENSGSQFDPIQNCSHYHYNKNR